GLPGRERTLVDLRSEPEMLCLLEGFDERHVHRVDVTAVGTRTRLRDVAPQFVPDDLLGEHDGLDESREIDAGVDAFALEEVHEVLGGDHAGEPAVAAVGAAAESADGGVDDEGVALVEFAEGGVGAQRRHAARVVQVHLEVPDLGPGVENPADLGTHGGGRVPAHRITEVDARDGNARGGPLVDLQLQDLHAAVLADLTGPVRSPARVDGDL